MPRIAILSDLHQEHWGAKFQMPQVDADLLVVAGDVMEPRFGDPVDWLLENTHPRTPVVFVPGNHDFSVGKLGNFFLTGGSKPGAATSTSSTMRRSPWRAFGSLGAPFGLDWPFTEALSRKADCGENFPGE